MIVGCEKRERLNECKVGNRKVVSENGDDVAGAEGIDYCPRARGSIDVASQINECTRVIKGSKDVPTISAVFSLKRNDIQKNVLVLMNLSQGQDGI